MIQYLNCNDEVPIDIRVTEFRQMMESAMTLFEDEVAKAIVEWSSASSEQANYASNMREISRALRGKTVYYSKFLKFTTLWRGLQSY